MWARADVRVSVMRGGAHWDDVMVLEKLGEAAAAQVLSQRYGGILGPGLEHLAKGRRVGEAWTATPPRVCVHGHGHESAVPPRVHTPVAAVGVRRSHPHRREAQLASGATRPNRTTSQTIRRKRGERVLPGSQKTEASPREPLQRAGKQRAAYRWTARELNFEGFDAPRKRQTGRVPGCSPL
eukprot:6366496-Prymnesium_polylepis.1